MLVKPDPHFFGIKVDSGDEIKAPPPHNTLILKAPCATKGPMIAQPILFTHYL